LFSQHHIFFAWDHAARQFEYAARQSNGQPTSAAEQHQAFFASDHAAFQLLRAASQS